MKRHASWVPLLAVLISLAQLAGCASFPEPGAQTTQDSSSSEPTPSDDDNSYLRMAVDALDRAAQLDGLERVVELEKASWAAARAQNPDLLNQALTLYPGLTLPPEQAARRSAWSALLASMRENAIAALRIISESQRPEDSKALSDYWLAYAEAYRLLDDGSAATLMLVRRDALLDGELRTANHQRIWDLQQQGARFLFYDESIRYDANTQGWLELGRIARQFWNSPQALNQALLLWDSNFPGHPAAIKYRDQARELAVTTLNSAVRRVGLLLPLSGRLTSAAVAVRDGFIAAHLANPENSLDIRIYDSGQDSLRAYDQAVADGAQLIVGPLSKTELERVAQQNAGALPMLALNYREQSAPMPSVLEFGLAPEDDARSAARQALDDGLSHAIALVSDDDFGRRSLAAFEQSFAAGGGSLLDASFFRGSARDYQTTIKSLLRLSESAHRFEAIQRLVGETLDSAPVRRQDAQFVFMAASPQEGRQLRPQLKFYHAEDLPIYSGGRIYSGQPSPRQDKDLNGVRFCAMPWLLGSSELWRERRSAVDKAWPARAKRFERLYAMGNDAYLLTSTLRNASWANLPVIPGATGELQRQGSRILRRLPCTVFERGVPQIRQVQGLNT